MSNVKNVKKKSNVKKVYILLLNVILTNELNAAINSYIVLYKQSLLNFFSQKAASFAARSHVEGFNPMIEFDIEHEVNLVNGSNGLALPSPSQMGLYPARLVVSNKTKFNVRKSKSKCVLWDWLSL